MNAHKNVAGGMAIPAGLSNTHTLNSDARVAALQARLAERGFDLQRLASGAVLICRWSEAREFDIEGAEAFARKVGA